MTTAFRAASAGSRSRSSYADVPVPASVQSGDILIAYLPLAQAGTVQTPTVTSPGWTVVDVRRVTDFDASHARAVAVLSKVAGSSEPSSYRFTFNASFWTAGAIAAFSGVPATKGTNGVLAYDVASVLGGSVTAPTLSGTTSSTLSVTLVGEHVQNPGFAMSGATKRWELPANSFTTSGGFTGLNGGAVTSTNASEVLAASSLLLAGNSAPNAPSVQVASTIDSGTTNRFSVPFSDPDPGDSQSQLDLQYWSLDGTGARVGAATTVSKASPNQWWDAAAGTFADGDYEIQGQSYDALGVASGWGPSTFFTAATPTGVPTITDPTSGGTIGTDPASVSWSTAGGQVAYQVRRVADNAGTADETTVYWDSGQITDANARSVSVPFETNNRWEHIQVRVTADGSLWSSWASIRVLASYTPPAAATGSLSSDAGTGSLLVSVTNPTPGSGEPSASYNEILVDDGDGKGFTTRYGSSMVAPNTPWRYWQPRGGRDYTGSVLIRTHGDNGTTTDTTI